MPACSHFSPKQAAYVLRYQACLSSPLLHSCYSSPRLFRLPGSAWKIGRMMLKVAPLRLSWAWNSKEKSHFGAQLLHPGVESHGTPLNLLLLLLETTPNFSSLLHHTSFKCRNIQLLKPLFGSKRAGKGEGPGSAEPHTLPAKHRNPYKLWKYIFIPKPPSRKQ